jgi:glycerophosphoryl diester phosphodiesterase
MQKHCVFILIFWLTCLCSVSVDAQQGNGVLPHSSNAFVVIAHRGNHTVYPENTLAAIKAAIEAGAAYVEIDVRETKDSVAILMHDVTVNRTTNGIGNVNALMYDELKNLSVKSLDGKQYQIPTLEEVLQLCKNKINIYLDFKMASVKKVWEQIQKNGMQHQVVVYPNNIEQYKQWQQMAPQIPIITSVPESYLSEDKLAQFFSDTKLAVVDNLYQPKLIKIAQQLGIKVWLDVESANENENIWNKYLKMGVNGLQTDKPEQLISYLKKYVRTNKMN